MKKLLPIIVLFAFVLGTVLPVAAEEPEFDELRPGEFVTLQQEIPIKIALVGFDESDVNEDALLAELPETYKPVNRYPRFYQQAGAPVVPRELGLEYNFEYDIINTGNDFEDAFFDYLGEVGTSGPPTLYQQYYSGTAPNLPNGQPNPQNQTGSVLDIDQSLYIDGPSVENWLATEGREMLDTDEDNAYFLYFINWHSEEDFQFHVYTKTDEPDPDTGYNFGELRQTRKIVAWGGSSSRTWFYDFSAGPEYLSGQWNLNNPDLDADNEPDYRIPPIWEYTEGGYRDFSELPKDMGLLTRYVALNVLFTTSPLYDPTVTTPGLGGKKIAHIEVIQADPASNGLDWVDAELVREQLNSFQPYYDWEVKVEATPVDAGIRRALEIFVGVTAPTAEDECVNEIGSTSAALYCYFRDNRDTYIPEYGPNDYVAEVFAFSVTDDIAQLLGGLGGFADDDYATGTQTYVFEFNSPLYRNAFGVGLTFVSIHEVGHHIGMSHPFDGYDYETDSEFGPSGPTYFTWVGNDNASVMGYLNFTTRFSTFDRDNMYRWETAGYLNKSNELLAEVLADPEANSVHDILRQADQDAREAQRAFDNWNYLEAATKSYAAYNQVRTAAQQIGVPLEPVSTLLVPPPTNSVPRHFDPILGGP